MTEYKEGDIVKNAECVGVGAKGDAIFKTSDGFIIIVKDKIEVGNTCNLKVTKRVRNCGFGEVI